MRLLKKQHAYRTAGGFRPRRRAGNTLLEVLLATTLLAGTLVPGLRLMRDAMRVSRDIETFYLTANYCVSTMERQLALTAHNWQVGYEFGDFAGDGHPQVRYFAWRSDASSVGGMPDRLMVISAIVWYDRNGDNLYNVGEPSRIMASKIAKLASY